MPHVAGKRSEEHRADGDLATTCKQLISACARNDEHNAGPCEALVHFQQLTGWPTRRIAALMGYSSMTIESYLSKGRRQIERRSSSPPGRPEVPTLRLVEQRFGMQQSEPDLGANGWEAEPRRPHSQGKEQQRPQERFCSDEQLGRDEQLRQDGELRKKDRRIAELQAKLEALQGEFESELEKLQAERDGAQERAQRVVAQAENTNISLRLALRDKERELRALAQQLSGSQRSGATATQARPAAATSAAVRMTWFPQGKDPESPYWPMDYYKWWVQVHAKALHPDRGGDTQTFQHAMELLAFFKSWCR